MGQAIDSIMTGGSAEGSPLKKTFSRPSSPLPKQNSSRPVTPTRAPSFETAPSAPSKTVTELPPREEPASSDQPIAELGLQPTAMEKISNVEAPLEDKPADNFYV
jgi:hypothetical protein